MPLPRFSPRQVATGVGLYVAAAVGGYLYLRSAKAPAPSPCGCGSRHGGAGTDVEGAGAAEGDNQATFDRLADQYDSLIAADETFMGLKLMVRRSLHSERTLCWAAAAARATDASTFACPPAVRSAAG